MDALSLDIRALKKSCIHIAQPDGRLIPFESFNMLYRDEKSLKLQELRRSAPPPVGAAPATPAVTITPAPAPAVATPAKAPVPAVQTNKP